MCSDRFSESLHQESRNKEQEEIQLGNRRRTVLLKITMAAVGLLNVWFVVVELLILMLGMLSKVQGGGQQRATTLQSLKTPPNNLAPPDSSYPTTLPLIATTKPH